jgi:hypothetical protein
MKKIILLSATIVVVCLMTITKVQATVGGPTIIHSLQYSPTNGQEFIYEQQNYGGKGCPPEIYAINIKTQIKRTLVSCDEGIRNSVEYNTKLENTLSQYPNLLKHIDLIKNKFSAKITAVKEHDFDASTGNFGGTDFQLDLFQNNEKKASILYSGCSKDQVHIIEGYAIPYKSTLVLLVSTKGDCFEGGYTRENLYIVPNISTYFDQTSLPVKNTEAARSGTGNISLIASSNKVQVPKTETSSYDTQTSSPSPETPINSTPNQESEIPSNTNYLITIGALVLIILVLIFKSRK